mmetsp:Transcript_5382/g.14511  ORF Transcript_5382/g.14511 Transcript_5382/m.14511 type:complete len:211 (-) Transcript_5382:958-1590(-)
MMGLPLRAVAALSSFGSSVRHSWGDTLTSFHPSPASSAVSRAAARPGAVAALCTRTCGEKRSRHSRSKHAQPTGRVKGGEGVEASSSSTSTSFFMGSTICKSAGCCTVSPILASNKWVTSFTALCLSSTSWSCRQCSCRSLLTRAPSLWMRDTLCGALLSPDTAAAAPPQASGRMHPNTAHTLLPFEPWESPQMCGMIRAECSTVCKAPP